MQSLCKDAVPSGKEVKEKQPLIQSDCFAETWEGYETVSLKSKGRALVRALGDFA